MNSSTSPEGSGTTEAFTNESNLNASHLFIPKTFFEAYNVYLYTMIVLGVPENLVVLLVFIRHPPTTTTDWFILFITLCDFMTSVITTPIYVTFTNGFWRHYGNTAICTLHMFISQSVVLSSSFLIAALAMDRYLKICRQIPSFSKTRARNLCICISAFTIILSLPCFIMYENRNGQCVSIVMDTQLFSYYMMVLIIFVLACLFVVFSYYKVTKAVIRSKENICRHNGEPHQVQYSCCLIPAFRRNKVQPSCSDSSQSGMFQDTQIRFVETELSSGSESFYWRQQDPRQVIKINKQDRKADAKCPMAQPGIICSTKTSKENPLAYKLACPGTSTENTKVIGNNMERKGQISSENRIKHNVPPYTTLNCKARLMSLRTTKISFLVCSIFILTWIPPWICFLLVSIPGMKYNVNVVKFMIFGRMTHLINTITNPVLYTWLNKRFRRYIVEIICCQKSR